MITMRQLAQRLRMCQQAESAWHLVQRELQQDSRYPYALNGTLRLDLAPEWGQAAFVYNNHTKLFGFDLGGRVAWGTYNAADTFSLHIAQLEAEREA